MKTDTFFNLDIAINESIDVMSPDYEASSYAEQSTFKKFKLYFLFGFCIKYTTKLGLRKKNFHFP